jgi:hypothetical protein
LFDNGGFATAREFIEKHVAAATAVPRLPAP